MFVDGLLGKLPADHCLSLLQLCHKFSSAALHRFTQKQRHLCWSETTNRDDVHPVMKEFNICTGYRLTGRGWRYYMRSAFQLHNETVNWLSHAIGGLLVLALTTAWQLQLPASADARDVSLAWMFCTASVLMHAASSLAHLMHNRSERIHCWLFFVDNAAVGLAGYCNNLLSITFFSSHGYYSFIAPVTIPAMVLGSICMSAGFSLALAAYRRRYNLATSLLMFGPSGCFLLFGIVPIVERQLQMETPADLLGVRPYAVFLLSVLCYASHFPERWWPGRFDLFGHSHQLFHCLATASHCLLLSTVFTEIHRDGPVLFSKRAGDWITVQTACCGLVVATMFSAAVVLLYCWAFRYDCKFVSRAARCCKTD